jgi:hypothetical protein
MQLAQGVAMPFRSRRREYQQILETANQLVNGFLAADTLAAAKRYITEHQVLLTPEYDEVLEVLADANRERDTMQGVILDNARWLFRRCREVGIDAALAERPYLFLYGEPDDSDLEGQSRLASDLLQQEGAVPAGFSELIAQVPNKLLELHDPGTLAMIRYARTGSLQDLNEALAAWTQVLHHRAYVSAPQWFRLDVLSDIGAVLFNRYRMTGDSKDLDRSINYLQRAVDESPNDSPERHTFLSNLSAALRERAALKGGGHG